MDTGKHTWTGWIDDAVTGLWNEEPNDSGHEAQSPLHSAIDNSPDSTLEGRLCPPEYEVTQGWNPEKLV